LQQQRTDGGEPSAPATPGLFLLSYTTPRDAAKVDVAIAHRITKDAYKCIDKSEDQLVLVSGDKDFVPVIVDLVEEGYTVKVAFWDQAAKELKDSLKNPSTDFLSLNPYFDLISSK
jgi:uncharacterized LabA/DUF88 family protein